MARGWKILVLTLLALAVIVLGYTLRAIFMPLLVALLIAYILNPIINLLEANKVPRIRSIVELYALLLVIVAALILWALPAAFSQGREFVEDTFTGQDPKINRLKPYLQKIGFEDWDQVLTTVKEKIKGHESELAKAGGTIAGAVASVMTQSISGFVTVFSFIALVPVYLFFLLKNLNPWWERIKQCIPRSYRVQVLSTLEKIHRTNAAFFRGQLTISLIEGAILFIGLWIFGVRFSLLFGLIFAVLSIVPFLGFSVAFVGTLLFVLIDTGGFTTAFWFVVGVFVLIQVLEGLVLQPMILGKETGLHPIMIILALLVSGELFGFFGMLIAIPIATTVKILFDDYVWPMFEEVADLTKVRAKPEGESPPPATEPTQPATEGQKPEAGSPKPEAGS